MWNNKTEPTQDGWHIVKVSGVKTPLSWNNTHKFFAGLDGKTYKISEIDCWLDDSLIDTPKPIQRPHKHCVCCNETIKVIDWMPNDKSWDGMFDNGIVAKISAGYGSNLDGNMYVLAICDDCVEIKHKEGVLEYVGDYMIKQ